MDADTLRLLAELTVIRDVRVPALWRAADDDVVSEADSLGLMEVRFSPFNQWYEINSWWEGRFLERTVKGSFKRTIGQHNDKNSSHDMKTLFNHGMDFHVGDKLLGDITSLKEESDSPVSLVNLWDTSYNRDLLPGLKRGAYGSSFMFRVMKDEWDHEPDKSDHNPEGLPERTIKETQTLEAGPVTWPASPTASAGMRCASGTDAYYRSLERAAPELVTSLRARVLSLRQTTDSAAVAPEPAELDEPETDDSPSRARVVTPAERQRYLRKRGLSYESG